VICSYSITEVSQVIKNKFPNGMQTWERFFTILECELIYTPSDFRKYDTPYIRDEKDIPILVSVALAKPDLFATGDKDFHTGETKQYLHVCTSSDFLRDFT